MNQIYIYESYSGIHGDRWQIYSLPKAIFQQESSEKSKDTQATEQRTF